MARAAGKSETLTIRLDQKTRFMLEFVARLKGQTITTVVDRAIADAADATQIVQGDGGFRGGDPTIETWRNYWDVVEGIRALKMAAESQLRPTYEEERQLVFAHKHWPFFYHSETKANLRSSFVEILWPRITEFVQIDDQAKLTDFWAAGKAMKSALHGAGLASPDWPPKIAPARRPAPNAPAFESGGMDDDIPF